MDQNAYFGGHRAERTRGMEKHAGPVGPFGPPRHERNEFLNYEAPRTVASRWGHHFDFAEILRSVF